MHSGMEQIKLFACQTEAINTYKNNKTKLLKCCANILISGAETCRLKVILLSIYY
jgi:hypothetical protein